MTMKFGWIPDLPDHNDHFYSAPIHLLKTLPPLVDLRPYCPPVYDQGELGSCTANAIAGAIEFDQIKQKLAEATPSRLFIYYNERVIEHSVSTDSGAMIKDGVKSVAKQGVCTEAEWPYIIDQFTLKPNGKCYTDALSHKISSYARVARSISQMKSCLTEAPIIFGFTVYESFITPQVSATGIVPMPKHGEAVLGGHAVLAVGYDDSKQMFICRNSWSDSWGDKGYFYMPYLYLLNSGLASDFWTIRSTN